MLRSDHDVAHERGVAEPALRWVVESHLRDAPHVDAGRRQDRARPRRRRSDVRSNRPQGRSDTEQSGLTGLVLQTPHDGVMRIDLRSIASRGTSLPTPGRPRRSPTSHQLKMEAAHGLMGAWKRCACPFSIFNRKKLSDPRRFAGFENGSTLALLKMSRRIPAEDSQRTLRDIAETLLRTRT